MKCKHYRVIEYFNGVPLTAQRLAKDRYDDLMEAATKAEELFKSSQSADRQPNGYFVSVHDGDNDVHFLIDNQGDYTGFVAEKKLAEHTMPGTIRDGIIHNKRQLMEFLRSAVLAAFNDPVVEVQTVGFPTYLRIRVQGESGPRYFRIHAVEER